MVHLYFVAVVYIVDLCSTSRSASNALNLFLRRKKMSFQRRFEDIVTRVSSRVPVWAVEASFIPALEMLRDRFSRHWRVVKK